MPTVVAQMTRGAAFNYLIEFGGLGAAAGTAKTLSSDRLALDTNVATYIVSAESGTADDIDGISGFNECQFLILRAATGHTLTLKDENAGAAAATDKIRLPGARDVAIADDEVALLYHDDTLDRWVLLAGPPPANSTTRTITVIIDGGGSAVTTGVKADVEIPFGCTINRVTALADQSGSIVVDIWKDTYANYPPTDADSITSATPPTITTATKSQDSTLTSWTTAITAGDTLRFNVDSCTTIQRVTLSIKVTET